MFVNYPPLSRFVELQANKGRSCLLQVACYRLENYPADKDLRTQYEWAKAWNKKRFRELGLDTKEWSDTDKDEDSRDAAGHPAGRLRQCAEEDNASASVEAQALKHTRTRKRRQRCITKSDKFICRVQAGLRQS